MECQAKLQIKMVWEDLLVLQANHHFLKPRVIHLMLQLPSQDHLQLFHHPDAHFLRTPCNKGRMCHQLNCREHRMKFAHADVDGVLPVAAVWGHNTARNLMEEGQTSQQAGFIFDYAKHIYIYIYLYAHVHIHYIYIYIFFLTQPLVTFVAASMVLNSGRTDLTAIIMANDFAKSSNHHRATK